MARLFGNLARFRKTGKTSSQRASTRQQLLLEKLEDRDVPSTLSTIAANFTPPPIPAGDNLWFDSSFKVAGIGPGTSAVTLHVTNQTVTFSASGGSYTENVPDATINLSSSTTVASTVFDPGSNSWITNLPIKFAGNAFLSGGILPVSAALPGGIKNVTWSGNFSTDTAGVNVNWQWGGAVYASLPSDYNALNVKPLDGGGAVTAYNNPDHAGTPEAYKTFVTAGATGNGGNNWTGNLTPASKVSPSLDATPSAGNGGALLYPFASSNPLTSIAFNESDVLVGANLDTTNGYFEVWYSDEHAMALGVRQVNVVTASGTTTTNYPIAPLTSDPGSAVNPALGTTASTGDQAGNDASGRPLSPSLYITDITNNPNNLSGDWQYGGTAYAPSAVFGTWKGFVKTVNYTTGTPTTTIAADADPAQNHWNLGAGADPVPEGLSNEGYGTEIRWNLNDLYSQGILIPGHTYRFYVMVHDCDQNKVGGDSGQAAYNYFYSNPNAQPPASVSGFVYGDNGAGSLSGLGGVLLTLTGTTTGGQQVTLTATTNADGSYSFGSLSAGTYTITQTLPNGYNLESDSVGTVNGTQNGSATGPAINTITLNPGDNGINYNFTDVLPMSLS